MTRRLYLVAIANIALTAALVLFPHQISISPLSAMVIAFLVNFPLFWGQMKESGRPSRAGSQSDGTG